MLDFNLLIMDPNSSQLKLTKGSNKKILNAANGLTFCIQVLEENSIPCPTPTALSESTISVVENEIEDDDIISHEIVDQSVAVTLQNATAQNINLQIDKTNQNGFFQDDSTLTGISSNGSADYQSTNPCISIKPIPEPKSSLVKHSINNGRTIEFNIKRKAKPLQVLKSKVNNFKFKGKTEVTSIVMNNVLKQKKNYSGMKMMVDPKSGNHVITNTYVKSSSSRSFPIEPWVLDKTLTLQKSKEKLFLLCQNPKSNLRDAKGDLCSNCNHPRLSGEERRDINPSASFSPIDFTKTTKRNENSLKSKLIHWEEGNIDRVLNYHQLSDNLRIKYSKSNTQKDQNIKFGASEFLPNTFPYYAYNSTKSGTALGVRTFLSWEAVKERIEELEEETMTKFTLDFRSPKFKDDPEPFKKIRFDLDTIRKDIKISIPNTGIPFIYIGIAAYSCHLGKKRIKTKDSIEEDLNKPLQTKRIGCPAVLAVFRIARFPDYDISDLSPDCEAEVLNELKDSWDFDSSRVRFYVEYHLQEPQASDHKGHELQYLVNSTRLKEPVDNRVIDKIRELTREGYTSVKVIHEKLNEFVTEELFKGVSDPPLHRRRYNPTLRDIRYVIHKSREELRKEGKSLVQLQCAALTTEIAHIVKEISHEEYLKQLKSYLRVLRRSLKCEEPLDSIFAFNNTSQTSSNTTPIKKVSKRRMIDAPTVSIQAERDFLGEAPAPLPSDQVMEQFYINMAPEPTEGVFGATHLYAQDLVDMNTGLADDLPPAPEDTTVTEVYYYYPDGTCELAIPEALANMQE